MADTYSCDVRYSITVSDISGTDVDSYISRINISQAGGKVHFSRSDGVEEASTEYAASFKESTV